MSESITPVSRAVSDVLTGAYKENRITQEEIAERTGMSIWSLQKKLKARAPISATDLVVIAQAIGVDPGDILNRAIQKAAASVSAMPVSLDARRAKKPAEMTDDEIEQLRGAAVHDTDLEEDEPFS